jgi:hypothetical protein
VVGEADRAVEDYRETMEEVDQDVMGLYPRYHGPVVAVV